MASVKVKLNMRGFRELRFRSDVVSACVDEAEAIAASCGDGYVAERGEGKTRGRAAVITTTAEAIRDNAANNTLVRAVGSRQGR